MKARLKRWFSPRRWWRALVVLSVLVGVGGAGFAAWLVLDKDRWFPEISQTATRVDDLESRVDNLEFEVSGLQSELGDKDTDTLSSRLDDVESAQEDHAGRLDDIESGADEVGSRVDDVETDASSLESRVGSLEPLVEDAKRQAEDACSELAAATDYESSC